MSSYAGNVPKYTVLSYIWRHPEGGVEDIESFSVQDPTCFILCNGRWLPAKQNLLDYFQHMTS